MNRFKLFFLALLALVIEGFQRFRTANAEATTGTSPEGKLGKVAGAAITQRYALVKVGADADHVILVASASDMPLGVCEDSPGTAGDYVTVDTLGPIPRTVKFVCATAIAAGTDLYSDGTGLVQALPSSAGTYWRVGRSVEIGNLTETANIYLIEAEGCTPQKVVVLGAITDNTTGLATQTAFGAGVGVQTIGFQCLLADIAAAQLLTTFTPGYKFKILALAFAVDKPATTGSKLATVTPQISGVSTTGGAVALTSAGATPQGTVIAGSAITALNTGAANATIGLVGSSVTAFVEGSGTFFLTIQNMDTADAIATLAAFANGHAPGVQNVVIG